MKARSAIFCHLALSRDSLVVSSGGTTATPALPALAFSPDGRTLAVDDQSGTVQLLDIATQQHAVGPMRVGASPVRTVAFSQDGKLLANVDNSGNLILWHAATTRQASPLDGVTDEPDSAAFSPDGQLLATAR